jgi:CheY-like chemotaxis protein
LRNFVFLSKLENRKNHWAMKRFYADEERIGFEKDDEELMDNLISDTRRICNNIRSGNKDGLEIFDDYIDLLGGTVWSESFYSGRQMIFSVPVGNKSAELVKEEEKSKRTYSWDDKTILIAEDEETNFLYLKAALSRTGVKILRARTGREAVTVIKTNDQVDLILMDIKMPEMNGIDATMEIKAFNKNMKIIAQTAYAMEDDRELYFQAGCIDYLAKPIHRDLLLTTISKYL